MSFAGAIPSASVTIAAACGVSGVNAVYTLFQDGTPLGTTTTLAKASLVFDVAPTGTNRGAARWTAAPGIRRGAGAGGVAYQLVLGWSDFVSAYCLRVRRIQRQRVNLQSYLLPFCLPIFQGRPRLVFDRQLHPARYARQLPVHKLGAFDMPPPLALFVIRPNHSSGKINRKCRPKDPSRRYAGKQRRSVVKTAPLISMLPSHFCGWGLIVHREDTPRESWYFAWDQKSRSLSHVNTEHHLETRRRPPVTRRQPHNGAGTGTG
ncbi:hypothetical protein DFH09DRAFT_1099669 [Mycena vulgaris]|nr:hypothetical protein DFH09DRAFT_1099669 [Mycena vulgaris]